MPKAATQLRDLPAVLRLVLVDPLGSVRRPLDFSWPCTFGLLMVSALLSGATAGAITRNKIDFLLGLFVFPITSVVAANVFAFFIYYFFSLFQSTFLDFRRLTALVSIAVVPYFLFHSVSSYIPPVDLIGFAFTCILLIVGLVEQFGVERRICTRLIAVLAVLYVAIWTAAQIRFA